MERSRLWAVLCKLICQCIEPFVEDEDEEYGECRGLIIDVCRTTTITPIRNVARHSTPRRPDHMTPAALDFRANGAVSAITCRLSSKFWFLSLLFVILAWTYYPSGRTTTNTMTSLWNVQEAIDTVNQTYEVNADLTSYNYRASLLFSEFLDQVERYACSGGIWTQTTDVEGEVNGLLTYDRRLLRPNVNQWKKDIQSLYTAAAGRR